MDGAFPEPHIETLFTLSWSDVNQGLLCVLSCCYDRKNSVKRGLFGLIIQGDKPLWQGRHGSGDLLWNREAQGYWSHSCLRQEDARNRNEDQATTLKTHPSSEGLPGKNSQPPQNSDISWDQMLHIQTSEDTRFCFLGKSRTKVSGKLATRGNLKQICERGFGRYRSISKTHWFIQPSKGLGDIVQYGCILGWPHCSATIGYINTSLVAQPATPFPPRCILPHPSAPLCSTGCITVQFATPLSSMAQTPWYIPLCSSAPCWSLKSPLGSTVEPCTPLCSMLQPATSLTSKVHTWTAHH